MAFAIPKIEYNVSMLVGDSTLGDGTISGFASVVGLTVGMFARGAGIPDNSTIGSIGSGSITLADGVLATSSNTDATYEFGTKIEFDFPPIEPNGEELENNASVSKSLAGVIQVSTNFVEANRKPKFSFISPSIYAQLDTFLRTFAIYGNSFRYYDDKTTTTYFDFELDSLKINPKKQFPKGVDTYIWEVTLPIRRVL